MNRRQRRDHHRRLHRMHATINQICAAAHNDGTPWTLHGLTDACRDCGADATLTALPDGRVLADIFHDDGCPAHAGAVPWQPVPID